MGMSRQALWSELGLLTIVEPVLLSAYENEEEEIWRKGLGNSPHGQPWHTSLHASSFPGDDPTVCGRAQVYGLMNPVSEKPLEPKIRAWFDLGTAIEHMFIKRLSNYGVLLSADITGDDKYQTGFEDPECWLTGSPDAIILPPFSNKAHVIDVKSTSLEKVESMKNDSSYTVYSHSKYVRQLKAYIYEANKKFSPTVVICNVSGLLIKNGRDSCAINHKAKCEPRILKVEPPDDGTLFYCAREEPLVTASYHISNDPKFIEVGKKRLKQWKQSFESGVLPEHVHEGRSSKWTVGECRYCDLKKNICKVDYKNKTKKLSESALIEWNKSIRPEYDYNKTKKEVLERWS